MSASSQELRWNGWGRLGESTGLTRPLEAALLEDLGRWLGRRLARREPPVALESVRVPPPKLSAETLAELRSACGDENVATSVEARVRHAAGRSLPDLLRLRRGELQAAPDAVVFPPDEGAVAAILRVAAQHGFAVVPFGGGTSVVGGVEPLCGEGQAGVLALDTGRLDRLLHVDSASGTATFQAGATGPTLERALRSHGLTLGHTPQSFEHSTLGGWIATRSCGQQSDGYGAIEHLVVSVRMVTPAGVVRSLDVPRSAAGPDIAALILGSEGTLGVIVEATLRVRPAPRAVDVRGLLLRDFRSGIEIARQAVREDVALSLLRLSDAAETEFSSRLHRDPTRRLDPAALLLAAVGRLGFGADRSLLLVGAEGARAGAVRAQLRRFRRLARAHGALPLGRAPGRAWQRDRFRTPYLRDWLLDHGVAVETLETAVPWSRVPAAHAAIRRALEAALVGHAGAGLVLGHLSHRWPDGACLYFTLLYPLEPGSDVDRDIAQWRAVERAGIEAVLAAGGTLTHHHGVGAAHAAWLVREKGRLGVDALRAVKRAWDPQSVMNPRKLVD